MTIFTHYIYSTRQGTVFSRVCHSRHRGGEQAGGLGRREGGLEKGPATRNLTRGVSKEDTPPPSPPRSMVGDGMFSCRRNI